MLPGNWLVFYFPSPPPSLPPLLHLCLPAALPQLIGSEVRLLFAHLLAEWRRLARITSTLLLFINAYNKGDRWVKGQLQEWTVIMTRFGKHALATLASNDSRMLGFTLISISVRYFSSSCCHGTLHGVDSVVKLPKTRPPSPSSLLPHPSFRIFRDPERRRKRRKRRKRKRRRVKSQPEINPRRCRY